MPELIGGGIGIGFFLLAIGAGCVGLFLPFMAWSAARNLKQIREQFERLNANIERGAAAPAPPVAQRQFTPAATSDNRTATARPGALGI